MSPTVVDFAELLKALEEHPEWREQLLRVLFPEVFLRLPELLAEATATIRDASLLVQQLIQGQQRIFEELGELQRRTDERFAELTEAQRRTDQRLAELTEAQRRTEEKVAFLLDAQRRTDERLDELAEAQRRTEEKVAFLLEAQRRTDERLDELAEAQRRTEEKVAFLLDAQRRTDERLAELTEAQRRTEEKVAFLLEAQRRTDERLAELAEAQRRTEEKVAFLLEAQRRTDEAIVRLTEAQERTEKQLAELAEAHYRLEARVGKLEDRVGWLMGEAVERRYRDRAPAYFGRWLRGLEVLDGIALAKVLDKALATGQVSEDERAEVLLADVVVRGEDSQGNPLILAVEASARIDEEDVKRAVARAAILSRVFSLKAVPVVAGQEIEKKTAALCQKHGVWWLLDGRLSQEVQATPSG